MSSKIEYFSENINQLQVVICDLCQKYFNGRIPYEQHLQSKNHKKKRQEKLLLEKMAEMKIRQSVLSKDTANMESNLCNYALIGENIPTKDVSESFRFKQPDRYGSLDDKVECLNTSFPFQVYSGTIFNMPSTSNDTFYDKCSLCMKFFSTAESAQVHFLSKEHRTKEKQRQMDILVNHYKDTNTAESTKAQIDRAKLLESLTIHENMSKFPYTGQPGHPLKITSTPNDQRMYPKCNYYSSNTKGIPEKMPLIDLPMTNSVDPSHFTPKSNEQKTYPGCDVCGIKSFVTLNASFNHNLTMEHCRKFAMYSKTSEPHMFSEKYASPPLPMNPAVSSNNLINDDRTQLLMDKSKVFPSRTSVFSNSENNLKFDEGISSHNNTASLFPIGYERKMKCKQTEEQNTGVTIHETISLPDSFNIDYGANYYISSYPLMRETQNSFLDQSMGLLKSDTNMESIQSEIELEQPLKYLGRRHPRIAAKLSNSNITPPPPQKDELEDFTISAEDNFHF